MQINLPSALISSLDVALSDGKLLSGRDDKSPEHFGSRKFPQVFLTFLFCSFKAVSVYEIEYKNHLSAQEPSRFLLC